MCASGDLLNRPWFQFHASEFDRGGETEREGPQPVMFPQGERTKGGKEGGRQERGQSRRRNLNLALQTCNRVRTEDPWFFILDFISAVYGL